MITSKKIVLLGHFGVGKSSLIRRFVEDTFSNDYKVTIGVHILKKEVNISKEEQVSLIIWDLEGTEDIKQVRSSYLLGTHGFVYVFDVSRPSTFENYEEEISFLQQNYPDTKMQIVGNKVDLVDLKDLKQKLKENHIQYQYLTSAKTGTNVNDMFTNLAKDLLNDVAKL
jgi:small GTP-binding protein